VRKATRPKAKAAAPQSRGKWVYGFGNGRAEGTAAMRDLLGGKGAGLAEMANLKLPVPPGFTITTDVCTYYYGNDKKYPKDLRGQVEKRWRESAASPEGSSETRQIRCLSRCAPVPAPRCRA
jgi:Phosphoenolpyruvate synthase/pyruvate phosphate dikinase